MTFTVETADLRGYVGLLNRNAEHNDRVLDYLRQWCKQDMQAVHSEGLLAKALDFHDRYVADAEYLVTELGRALRGSAVELEKAARLYDGSDRAAKERFERHGSRLPLTREGWEAGHSGYADYMNPIDVINGSPHPEEFGDPTKVLDSIGDTISASGTVVNLLQQITGRNIVEEVVQFLTGDWQAYSRAGTAWRHIGEALERIGKNVDRGLASLDHAWDGTASEAAYAAFQQLATVFKQMLGQFQQLADVYQAFARFAMHTASVLADTLKLAIDTVLALALRGRSGPFPEALAVFNTFKIIKYVGYLGWTMITARGTVAAIFGGTTLFRAADLPQKVKAMAYDAPGL